MNILSVTRTEKSIERKTVMKVFTYPSSTFVKFMLRAVKILSLFLIIIKRIAIKSTK